ncbi:hypothetical protein I4U23_001853 [Adineta vaga]|nr:hypothetical protein I4U23_001853 [Adineta vaga]
MASSVSPGGLNKDLYTDITRLKLLDKDGAEVRFKLFKTPFSGEEEDDDLDSQTRQEYVITGLIYPNSKIYQERAFEIEIKLSTTFPVDPPTVRFLTSMYHPNVAEDGDFCNELLTKTNKWTSKTSLVEIIKIVVQHIDEPDDTNPIRPAVGVEYKNDRALFEKNAKEHVLKYGQPRT